MSEEKEQIVQTTVRMPRSLKARLDKLVFDSKQAGQKASIDATVQQALELLLSGNQAEIICPICSSVLQPGPKGTEVVSTPKPPVDFQVPEASRHLVQSFLDFIAEPGRDDHVRDFILQALAKS